MKRAVFTLVHILWSLSSPAEPTKGVDLQLLSEVASIQAGVPFTVGLHVHHHDGYHTYWRNPGVVGIPTQLDWTLPEGFSAGPIQWPSPEIVDMAGHPAHGFRRDVLLMVDITPPNTIKAQTITLLANATWMACARSCHPGNAKLSLTLPVGNATIDPSHGGIFSQARKQLPRPMKGWTVEVLSKIDASPIRLRLVCLHTPTTPLETLYFFSSDGQVSSDKPQTLETTQPGHYILTLQRAEFGPSHTKSLPGILARKPPGNKALLPFGAINPHFPDKNARPTP